MNGNSKEEIKSRIVRNAVHFWELKNINDLDPLVRLLLEALASEIYRLSNEVNNIEVRLLEKMARMLTPDIIAASQPAHMILFTIPGEPVADMSKMMQVYLDQNSLVTRKKKLKNITFTPVDNFRLYKGYVRYMISGQNVYHVTESQGKIVTGRSPVRHPALHNTMWIGLEMNEMIENWQYLHFYFDFPGFTDKERYFSMLQYSQWKTGKCDIPMAQGIPWINGKNDGNGNTFFDHDIRRMTETTVKHFYNHRFLHVAESFIPDHSERRIFPVELMHVFPASAWEKNDRVLHWIKVIFPANFLESLIEDAIVSLNAFPALNRRMRKIIRNISHSSGIIALETDPGEYFHTVESITDSRGREYKLLPYRNSNKTEYGSYSIKRGGVERFNSNDAGEYINQLMDLLRDESSAFISLGNEKIRDLAEQARKLIAKIGVQAANAATHMHEITSYLVITPVEKDEIVEINYWVMNGEAANDIRKGVIFKNYGQENEVKSDFHVLSTSQGGQHLSHATDRLDSYKYILTSRNRIITHDDIVNFCRHELGNRIIHVEVTRGVMLGQNPKQGLMRTIDVYLTPSAGYEQLFVNNESEWKREIQNKLEQRSPDTFIYRVFVKKYTDK